MRRAASRTARSTVSFRALCAKVLLNSMSHGIPRRTGYHAARDITPHAISRRTKHHAARALITCAHSADSARCMLYSYATRHVVAPAYAVRRARACVCVRARKSVPE